MGHCLGRAAAGLAAAAQQLADRLKSPPAASAPAQGADTESKLQQGRVDAALLAVLLARSLVEWEDAQQAAAAAAGTTPAQLFAR
jgi:hypothetical protein